MISSPGRRITALSISIVVVYLGLLTLAAGGPPVVVETVPDDPLPAPPVVTKNQPSTGLEALRAGTLDPAFGVQGIVTMPWPFADNMGPLIAMLIQPDGKILLGGGGKVGLRLIRCLNNGSLDPTFGSGGIATFDPTGQGAGTVGMALLSDGRIVVAGGFSYPYGRFIARFNPDGSPDPSFGSGGYVVVGPPETSVGIQTMALQPDGRIVVGGQSSSDFYLARFYENGDVDDSFGSAGVVTTDLPMVNSASISSILLQPDGRIIASGAGVSDVTYAWEVALARYQPDGTLDTSFGSGGTLDTDVFNGARWGVLQSDGRIVVAGMDQSSLNGDMAAARLYSDGMLDASFGDGGITRVDFKRDTNRAETGLMQADGKLVLGGYAFSTSKPGQTPTSSFGIARFLPDGRLDRSFGKSGTVAVTLGHPELHALALQSDGSILAAGDTIDQDTGILSYFIARFRSGNHGHAN